jgi:uncharacterized membrane protein YeiB
MRDLPADELREDAGANVELLREVADGRPGGCPCEPAWTLVRPYRARPGVSQLGTGTSAPTDDHDGGSPLSTTPISGSTPAGEPPSDGPDRQGSAGRIVGVDIARALAIIGMVMVHVGPTGGEGVTGRLYALPHGRASLLFVLVAGVGVSMLGRSPTTGPGRFRLTLLWRAALLLPVGLALQLLDHGVNVILQTYALLFVIALAAHALPDRWLLVASAAFTVIGPGAFLRGTIRAPEAFDRDPVRWGDPLGEMVHELVLSGPYPLLVWVVPLLFGMWLGRQDLRSRAVAMQLVVVGAVTAVGSAAVSAVLSALVVGPGTPEWLRLLVSATPHSQMPLWLLNGVGAAVAVLGAMLLLDGAARRPVAPFVAAGQLALTLYVGHLVVLDLFPDHATADDVGAATARVAIATVVMLAGAHAWRSRFARGPLELLMRLPARAP